MWEQVDLGGGERSAVVWWKVALPRAVLIVGINRKSDKGGLNQFWISRFVLELLAPHVPILPDVQRSNGRGGVPIDSSQTHVVKELGSGLHARHQQMVSGSSTSDVQQLPFGIINLL